MTMHTPLFRSLTAILMILAASSCATLTVRKARSAPVEPGSTVGILCENQEMLSLCLTASLLDAKFKVKPVAFEELLPRALLKDLGPERYSLIQNLVENLDAGGNLKGDGDTLGKVLALNDLKDKRNRLQDYLDLIDSYAVKAGIRYFLYIEALGRYRYAARCVDLKSRETIFVYYIAADKAGFHASVPAAAANPGIVLKSPVIPVKHEEIDKLYIRLAEFLVGQLK